MHSKDGHGKAKIVRIVQKKAFTLPNQILSAAIICLEVVIVFVHIVSLADKTSIL